MNITPGTVCLSETGYLFVATTRIRDGIWMGYGFHGKRIISVSPEFVSKNMNEYLTSQVAQQNNARLSEPVA